MTAGEVAQVVVPAGAWQAARPIGDWALVGCIVTPAFEFDGFRLAPGGLGAAGVSPAREPARPDRPLTPTRHVIRQPPSRSPHGDP